MKETKYYTGDYALTRGDKFISRGIRFFMRIYRKTLGLPNDIVYNHAFLFVEEEDGLYIIEAGPKGLVKKRYTDSLYKEMLVYTPKKKLTINEKKRFAALANYYQDRITRYDFLFILRSVGKAFTNKWYKPSKKPSRRMACSEYIGTVWHDFNIAVFVNYINVNPEDLKYEKFFKIKK